MMHQMKFATSNLKKSAFATAINIIGLTTAFAAFILIMLYVWNEHQFDCFNEHNTEIYRLEIKSPLNPKTSVYMFGPTGKTLVDEFPEVLASTTYMPWGRWNEETFTWERNGNEIKSFENYAYSDEFLTDIFTFNIVNGKTIKPLLEPQTAMVSESFAKKAWKSADVVGKKLISGNSTYTISAVYADLEPNSVIQSPIILKMPETGWLAEAAKGWDVVNYPQFIKVKPGVDTEHLNSIINSQSIVREKYYFFNKGNVQAEIVARPLRDLHFTGESSETPMFTTNSLNFVNSLFWVGILILLVALINYVNFLTANVPGRIKSISITRIIGSSRLNSISIFIIETLLIFAISFIMALGSAWFVNQNFTESIIGYKLPHEYGLTTTIGVGVFLLALVAGLYPALYSTRGKPVETIKRFQSNTKINLRGVLTVFQFTATIALIALSTLIIKQIKFIETTNLGFNKYNTLVIRMNDELRKNFESFTNNLKSSPFIQDIACSRAIPGQAQEMTTFNIDGQQCQIWYWATDDNYIHMMDFELVEGRNFLKNSEAEIRNMICNETAAQKYGWTPGTKIGDGVLVGIIKDFNFISLREQVEAFSFWYTNDKNFFQYISLKVQPENIKQEIGRASWWVRV